MSTTPAFNLLLVDSDEARRSEKAALLRENGWRVVEAPDGATALRSLEDFAIDLALIGVELPDTCGHEVSRLVKTRHPDVLVLQTSPAFVSSSERAAGLETGADACLVEPASPTELLAQVKALLRIRKAERELRKRNRTLALLSWTGQHLLSSEEPAVSQLQSIFERTGEELGLELFYSYEVGREPGTLRLCGSGGLTPGEREAFAVIRIGEYLCGKVAERRERLVVEDMETAPYAEAKSLCAAGIRCYAGFPLLADGHFLGTVAFATRRRSRLAEDELQTVQSVCDQAAARFARVRSEKSLRKSEERFRLATAAAGALVYDIDLEGARPPRTFGLERVTGYTNDPDGERSSTWWHELIHPDDRPAHLSLFEERTRSGGRYASQYRVRHAGGAWIWVEDTAEVIPDALGRPARLVGTILDISSRKAAEERLRETELRLAAFAETVSSEIWITDATTQRLIYASKGFETIFGYPLEELYADPRGWIELVHPEDRERIKQLYRRAAETGGFDVTYRIVRRDGRLAWVRDYCVPIRDEEGLVVQIAGIAEDVTASKEVELRLQRGEQRLRLALEAAGSGIYDLDVKKGVSVWSKELNRLLGRPEIEEEVPFDTLPSTIHPDDRARVVEDMRKASRREGVYAFEFRIIRPDGSTRWVFDRGECFGPIDSNGNVARVTGTVVDVTSLKEAEERLSMALDAAGMEAFVWDVKTDQVERTQAYSGLTSIAALELGTTGREFLAFVHEDDREEMRQRIRALTPASPKLTYDYRMRSQGGETIWLRDIVAGEFDASGTLERIRGVAVDITDRRRAEEAVRESEARFRTMADHSPGMVWVGGPDGGVTYMSRSWYELTGQEADEPLGRGWLKAVHPDDRERVAALDRVSMETRGPFRAEYRLRSRRHGWRWILDLAAPHYSASGEFMGWVGSAMDISDRKAAEEALAEAQRFSQGLVEAAPSLLYVLEIDEQRISYVSPQSEALLGYSVSEVSALGADLLHGMVHPEDTAVVADHQLRFTEKGESGPLDVEYRVRHKDGSWRWLSSRDIVYRRDALGRPTALLGSALDVTEKKRAEAALRESEERFRNLADNMAPFAWMADETGSIFWYNKRWFEYTGTTLDEMRGWGWRAVHHPDHVARVVEKIARCFASGEVWEDTFPLRSRTGEYRWFLSRANPIRSPDGRILRWFGTNTDVTEQRRAEESLRESEARFRLLADSAPVLIWINSPEGNVFVNRAYREFVGVESMAGLLGMDWAQFVHPDDRRAYLEAYMDCVARRDYFEAQFRFRRADGEYRWMKSAAVPRFSESGEFLGYIGSSFDISDVKRAEEHIRLLMREVNHRSKNLLTVVQSIARQTARDSSPEDFAAQLIRRLQGISASQDLIVEGNWGGVTMGDLVRSQLAHLGEDALRSRVTMAGDRVIVTPAAAQGIGMALHELATNAIKYGALSNETGHIAVEWSATASDPEGRFRISWREMDGPPVAPPRRRGFGHTVVERMAALAVGGSVDLSYAPAGLSWTLEAPAHEVLYMEGAVETAFS